MGGFGSGRYSHYAWHGTVEGYRTLDIAQFKKSGFPHGATLSVTWTDGNSIRIAVNQDTVRLIYKYRQGGGRWQEVSEDVRLRYTRPYYGGRRSWFECPRCYRRARKLYAAGRLFLCRQCYGLKYSSQNEDAEDRCARKVRKIRARLGGGADLTESFPERPKGMHRTTYYRLWKADEVLNYRLYGLMVLDLQRLTGKIG